MFEKFKKEVEGFYNRFNISRNASCRSCSDRDTISVCECLLCGQSNYNGDITYHPSGTQRLEVPPLTFFSLASGETQFATFNHGDVFSGAQKGHVVPCVFNVTINGLSNREDSTCLDCAEFNRVYTLTKGTFQSQINNQSTTPDFYIRNLFEPFSDNYNPTGILNYSLTWNHDNIPTWAIDHSQVAYPEYSKKCSVSSPILCILPDVSYSGSLENMYSLENIYSKINNEGNFDIYMYAFQFADNTEYPNYGMMWSKRKKIGVFTPSGSNIDCMNFGVLTLDEDVPSDTHRTIAKQLLIFDTFDDRNMLDGSTILPTSTICQAANVTVSVEAYNNWKDDNSNGYNMIQWDGCKDEYVTTMSHRCAFLASGEVVFSGITTNYGLNSIPNRECYSSGVFISRSSESDGCYSCRYYYPKYIDISIAGSLNPTGCNNCSNLLGNHTLWYEPNENTPYYNQLKYSKRLYDYNYSPSGESFQSFCCQCSELTCTRHIEFTLIANNDLLTGTGYLSFNASTNMINNSNMFSNAVEIYSYRTQQIDLTTLDFGETFSLEPYRSGILTNSIYANCAFPSSLNINVQYPPAPSYTNSMITDCKKANISCHDKGYAPDGFYINIPNNWQAGTRGSFVCDSSGTGIQSICFDIYNPCGGGAASYPNGTFLLERKQLMINSVSDTNIDYSINAVSPCSRVMSYIYENPSWSSGNFCDWQFMVFRFDSLFPYSQTTNNDKFGLGLFNRNRRIMNISDFSNYGPSGLAATLHILGYAGRYDNIYALARLLGHVGGVTDDVNEGMLFLSSKVGADPEEGYFDTNNSCHKVYTNSSGFSANFSQRISFLPITGHNINLSYHSTHSAGTEGLNDFQTFEAINCNGLIFHGGNNYFSSGPDHTKSFAFGSYSCTSPNAPISSLCQYNLDTYPWVWVTGGGTEITAEAYYA